MDRNHIDNSKLKKLIKNHFALEEIKSLCFDLGIPYEDIPGQTKDAKARELIAYCERNSQIEILMAELEKQRPHVNWTEVIVESHYKEHGVEPISEDNSSFLSPICNFLFDKLKWIWLTYTIWLFVSALGFVASLVDVFGLTCRMRLSFFFLLAFFGGGIILYCGWFYKHKAPFKRWDKILTTILWILSTSLLFIFSIQCSNGAFPYNVKITNTNGEAVPNVKVTLQIGSDTIPDVISDENGIGRFFLDDQYNRKPAQIVIPKSDNCNAQTISVVIEEDQQLPHPIQLTCNNPPTPTPTPTPTPQIITDTPSPTKTSTLAITLTPIPTPTPTPPDSCGINQVTLSNKSGGIFYRQVDGDVKLDNFQLPVKETVNLVAQITVLHGCDVTVIWSSNIDTNQSEPRCKELSSTSECEYEFDAFYEAPDNENSNDEIRLEIETTSQRTGERRSKSIIITIKIS